jgi:hypothetical protein
MDRSASYRIIIIRTTDGYLAWSPAFPGLSGRATSARAAYKQLKDLITKDLSYRFSVSQPVPTDPVVQTRTFRIDLWYLRQKEELQ